MRAALAVYKSIKRQRASLRARAASQIEQLLRDGQQHAAVAVVMLAGAALQFKLHLHVAVWSELSASGEALPLAAICVVTTPPTCPTSDAAR